MSWSRRVCCACCWSSVRFVLACLLVAVQLLESYAKGTIRSCECMHMYACGLQGLM